MLESNLKLEIEDYFASLPQLNPNKVTENLLKENYRIAHKSQREEKFAKNRDFFKSKINNIHKYIANGKEIEPSKIDPEIEVVKVNTQSSDIFRIVSLNWSIPVSVGYGRRIRFLVWDKNIGKLIGIFALGDAVFNLKARDDLIGWSAEDRKQKLVNLMDAYILGALPGYSNLLGGKLIASLIKTKEITDIFRDKYANSTGFISKKKKDSYLSYVSVTSALGRSSIYNRVKLENDLIFKPIGMTNGWGHFHVSDQIFSLLLEYLISINDEYATTYKFGNGANWKIRVIKRALSKLGISSSVMQHGYQRQIFLCEMAKNAKNLVTGKDALPDYSNLNSFREQSQLALERWVIPRSCRDESYIDFRNTDFLVNYAKS
jgi:hypothetical protein